MAFMQIDEFDFDEILAHEFNKDRIVILVFSSQYCDACMALGFELEEIDDKYEHVSVLEIDCADSEELTQRYGVIQVPTMIIYENANSKLWHKEGVMLAHDIEEIIKS